MTREYCDRCGVEVTGEKSGSIHAGDDCDADGTGTMNDHWDIICGSCYRAFKAWMKDKPAKTKRERRI